MAFVDKQKVNTQFLRVRSIILTPVYVNDRQKIKTQIIKEKYVYFN